MRVLVTGGAGCIGSDLVEALLSRGHEVTAVDNLSSGKLEHVAPFLKMSGFRLVEGDLLDCALLDGLVRDAEFVYHLAANPDVKFTPGDVTDKDLRQNTIATFNVLEAMRRHGVRKLAFSSTSAVYGISPVQPIPESAFYPLPISLYGATKLACEAQISAFQNLFSMRCWIFRFANVVGPKTRKTGGTVIGDFVGKLSENPRRLLILGNGRQAKSYLLSQECVEAMLHVVDHAGMPLNIFNLGCEDSLPVNRIAEMVAAAMGLEDVVFQYTGTEGGWPGDVPHFRLDVTALNRLGWKARHNSEQAVAIAIQAMLRQMESRTMPHTDLPR
jgi:UDP-glucose 4-epimerase